MPVISQQLVDVLPGVAPIDICTYNYYCGLLLLGLRRFKESMVRFNQVLLIPTKIVHQVHVDAYKKLQLIALIQGNEYKLPSRCQ